MKCTWRKRRVYRRAQNEKFDRIVRERMAGSGLEFEFA